MRTSFHQFCLSSHLWKNSSLDKNHSWHSGTPWRIKKESLGCWWKTIFLWKMSSSAHFFFSSNSFSDCWGEWTGLFKNGIWCYGKHGVLWIHSRSTCWTLLQVFNSHHHHLPSWPVLAQLKRKSIRLTFMKFCRASACVFRVHQYPTTCMEWERVLQSTLTRPLSNTTRLKWLVPFRNCSIATLSIP